MPDASTRTLLDSAGMAACIERMAREICESNRDAKQLALVGVHAQDATDALVQEEVERMPPPLSFGRHGH